jgi:adenylate kinase family enzyme
LNGENRPDFGEDGSIVETPPLRLGVIGPPGSGKSHLARMLSADLGVPAVELDAIFWLPGWRRRDRDEFMLALREIGTDEAVIVVGNYSKYAAHYWPGLSGIVWLDLPRLVTFPRLVRRTTVDFVSRREVQPGCRQTLRSVGELLREGLVARRKIRTAVEVAQNSGSRQVLYRLRSRAAVDAFIDRMRAGAI